MALQLHCTDTRWQHLTSQPQNKRRSRPGVFPPSLDSCRYVSPYCEIKCEDLWPCGITRRWLMLPRVASTLLLSAKCLKSQLSKAWQGCQALRFGAWVLLTKKQVFRRISFRKCVTRWVVTCWLLTLLLWSACGESGELYAQLSALAAPSTGRHADVGRCLKSVGGRAACCRFFKPWSANVQPSRLLANLQSGSGPFSFFFYFSLFFFSFFPSAGVWGKKKNNLSDTRESAANQFERISWVLMDYRLSVHSVPLALLEYVTNCAFWHPGGVSISSLPRTHTLS